GERANPLAGRGVLPVLPDTRETEWRAILHRDGVRLLRPLPLYGLPLEEAIHRHDTAPCAIGVPKAGQVSDRLALSVDWLAAASRVTAPVRDEAPTQRVERHLAVPMVATDDQQILARRGVPARRVVVHAAVAHVHAIDNGVPQRSTALDDSPAHGLDVILRYAIGSLAAVARSMRLTRRAAQGRPVQNNRSQWADSPSFD